MTRRAWIAAAVYVLVLTALYLQERSAPAEPAFPHRVGAGR